MKIEDKAASARVQVVDDDLYVVYDTEIDRYEVHDRRAPGGQQFSQVMRVMNPDGTFRPVDQRTIDTLYELRHKAAHLRPQDVMRDLRQKEAARAAEKRKELGDLAYGIVDDLKWAGRDVVQSTLARDRTDPVARARMRDEIASVLN